MLMIQRFISDPRNDFGSSDVEVLKKVDTFIAINEITKIITLTCEMFPVTADRNTYQSQATLIYEEIEL